jgi:hypothetical protein
MLTPMDYHPSSATRYHLRRQMQMLPASVLRPRPLQRHVQPRRWLLHLLGWMHHMSCMTPTCLRDSPPVQTVWQKQPSMLA